MHIIPAADEAFKNKPAIERRVETGERPDSISKDNREIFRHKATIVVAAIVCLLLTAISVDYYLIG